MSVRSGVQEVRGADGAATANRLPQSFVERFSAVAVQLGVASRGAIEDSISRAVADCPAWALQLVMPSEAPRRAGPRYLVIAEDLFEPGARQRPTGAVLCTPTPIDAVTEALTMLQTAAAGVTSVTIDPDELQVWACARLCLRICKLTDFSPVPPGVGNRIRDALHGVAPGDLRRVAGVLAARHRGFAGLTGAAGCRVQGPPVIRSVENAALAVAEACWRHMDGALDVGSVQDLVARACGARNWHHLSARMNRCDHDIGLWVAALQERSVDTGWRHRVRAVYRTDADAIWALGSVLAGESGARLLSFGSSAPDYHEVMRASLPSGRQLSVVTVCANGAQADIKLREWVRQQAACLGKGGATPADGLEDWGHLLRVLCRADETAARRGRVSAMRVLRGTDAPHGRLARTQLDGLAALARAKGEGCESADAVALGSALATIAGSVLSPGRASLRTQ